jgi:hypothetical protein
MRKTFLLGRLTPKTAEIVVVEREDRPVFPGPWRLKALIRPATPKDRPGRLGRLVH